MLKYCCILNEETGLVQLGVGCPDSYYIEIGMQQRDVNLSEVDNCWYLSEKCPHYTEEEKLNRAKENKYREANAKAYAYLDDGEAAYELTPTQHIEATDGNIAKFTAYALAFVTGQLQPEDTVVWSTKEDQNIELTQSQVSEVLNGLGAVQAYTWTVKYTTYVQAIEAAETVEEVEDIIIDYSQDTNEIRENGEEE